VSLPNPQKRTEEISILPNDRDVILSVRHLEREVDGKRLVNVVSLEVERGQVVAVVGPSGAGKSCFLRLLNRLDEPTAGTVFLDGQDYRDLPPTDLRRRVGMLMQAPHLFPGTVAENIRFGPRQRGETLTRETIEGLLEGVGLAGFAEREVSNLSGGEAQRVSLARTLANRPEVLLLDEPTSALDDETERDVEALIAAVIREYDLTCLIVTHDIEQARRLAKRVIVMESGERADAGSVEEVLDA
jgi:putative ABC transport system ATP-binding protein